MQDDIPDWLWYVPALHDKHVPGVVAAYVVEYLPVAQWLQVERDAAPCELEYVPRGQSVHVLGELAPVVLEYLPAGQLLQEVSGLVEKVPIVARSECIRKIYKNIKNLLRLQFKTWTKARQASHKQELDEYFHQLLCDFPDGHEIHLLSSELA